MLEAQIHLLSPLLARTIGEELRLAHDREEDILALDTILRNAREIPEQPYEGCMFARVLHVEGTKYALLMIRFLHGLGLERLPMHRHMKSSRKILVIEGEGAFHYRDPDSGERRVVPVRRGSFVSFPADFCHTFTTGDYEMRVLAVHEPFQELDDPEIIEY